MDSAWTMGLTSRCGNFPGFEQLFETAEILAHHKLWIFAKERGETGREQTAG